MAQRRPSIIAGGYGFHSDWTVQAIAVLGCIATQLWWALAVIVLFNLTIYWKTGFLSSLRESSSTRKFLVLIYPLWLVWALWLVIRSEYSFGMLGALIMSYGLVSVILVWGDEKDNELANRD